MSTENIITLVIAVGGLITAVWTARSTATKAELESLRKTIETLQGQNDRLTMENNNLRERVGDLENKTREQDKASSFLVDRARMLEGERTALQARVDVLEKKNTDLQCENDKLLARIAELENAMRPKEGE